MSEKLENADTNLRRNHIVLLIVAVIVQGKKVTLKVNGKTMVEYNEPEDQKAGSDFTRKIDEGTFALQAHDPGSKVYFRNLRVKRLD